MWSPIRAWARYGSDRTPRWNPSLLPRRPPVLPGSLPHTSRSDPGSRPNPCASLVARRRQIVPPSLVLLLPIRSGMTGAARQAQQDAYRLVNAGTGIVEVRRVVGDLGLRV